MKLTLFGVTGPSGAPLIEKALADGHEVTVYARNPGKLIGAPGRLTIIEGELSDAASIAQAITGRDAVISLLGPTGKTAGRPITSGTKAIVAAMEASGVRRLIAVATPSASDPNDRFALGFGLAVRMVRALMPDVYGDIVGTADAVRSSKLDWTLARLPMLDSKQGSTPAHAGYLGQPGVRLLWLSRNVLADFLLSQLDDRRWLHKAPVICNRA